MTRQPSEARPPSYLLQTVPYEKVPHLLVGLMSMSVMATIILDHVRHSLPGSWIPALMAAPGLVACLRMLHAGMERSTIGWVVATVVVQMWIIFPASANHHWMFLWVVAPLVFHPKFATRDVYSRYVSLTFGIMMIAAGVQKLISGNYIDGSFLAWLAAMGSYSEQVFNLVCSNTISSRNLTPCNGLVVISWAAVAWQFIVGGLLVCHVRHTLIYLLEAGFVLSVGIAADELAFQALSLCALLIASRLPMPVWFPVLIVIMKGVSFVTVSGLIYLVWIS